MEEKYNILLVIRWPVGGIRTFLKYVYNLFDINKYKFTIILPQTNEKRALVDDLKKINPEFIWLPEEPSYTDFIKNIIKTIKTKKIDLIHSHGSVGIYSALPARIWQIPHIITTHDALYKELSNEDEIIKIDDDKINQLEIFSEVMNKNDGIHFVGNDLKKHFLENFPQLSKKKIKLISIMNGIETSQYSKSEVRNLHKELNLNNKSFLIGYLGRLMPRKGFKFLIDALEYVLQDSSKISKKPFVLVFGGEGDYFNQYKKYVKKKNLDKNILFLPFTPNIASTLKGFDVIVIPSLWEACSLLPMEAMVSSIPVIGTDCIGLGEVLKDTPNTVVSAGDSIALGKALIEEINNPSRQKVEEFREEAIKRFDVKKQAEKLEELYLELIQNKK